MYRKVRSFFSHPFREQLRESAAMSMCFQATSACLLLLLLVCVEPFGFCSEQPYDAAQPPLTRGDDASSHHRLDIYNGLSCADDYITAIASLARADVTRRPCAASLVQVMSVVVMARLAVCILSMAFGINSSRRRYNFIHL